MASDMFIQSHKKMFQTFNESQQIYRQKLYLKLHFNSEISKAALRNLCDLYSYGAELF